MCKPVIVGQSPQSSADFFFSSSQSSAAIAFAAEDADERNGVSGTSGQILSSEGSGGGVEWIDAGVKSSTSGEPSGSDSVINIVSLTQAEYDAGTPVATTLYIIT